MRLKDIVRDDDIYPRTQVSQKTVESYVEALKAGAKFPPILVQDISIDDKVQTVSLDGWHTLEAYKAYNKLGGVEPVEDIEVTYWQDMVLDKEEHLNELRLESAFRNILHGDRLSLADRERQARRIVELDPKIENGVLAEKFGVTERTIIDWVKDIRARFYASRDSLIYRLGLLGWKQEEIADYIGDIKQPRVAQIISEVKNFTSLIKSDFFDGHKPIDKICDYYQIDEPLAWAFILEGKDDLERFKLFGNSEYGNDQPRMSDHWFFTKGDPRLGITDYEGRLFGQQAMNILYYYSQQGDLVVDPMAGGGTTLDTCLVMNRKCRAYDINPARKDIEKHDALTELPSRAINCDLIILDPPYYKKKEEEYGCFELTKDRETYLNNMRKVAQNCFTALKDGKYLALIHGQYIDYEDEMSSVLNSQVSRLFEEVGFSHILTIQTPLSFDTQWHGGPIEEAKQHNPWHILPVSRDWYIFKKV